MPPENNLIVHPLITSNGSGSLHPGGKEDDETTQNHQDFLEQILIFGWMPFLTPMGPIVLAFYDSLRTAVTYSMCPSSTLNNNVIA